MKTATLTLAALSLTLSACGQLTTGSGTTCETAMRRNVAYYGEPSRRLYVADPAHYHNPPELLEWSGLRMARVYAVDGAEVSDGCTVTLIDF